MGVSDGFGVGTGVGDNVGLGVGEGDGFGVGGACGNVIKKQEKVHTVLNITFDYSTKDTAWAARYKINNTRFKPLL